MTRWHNRYGFTLAIAIACAANPMSAWSADQPAAKPGARPARVVRPAAKSTPTQQKQANAPTGPTAANEVTPTNYTSVADIQDAATDECEAMTRRSRLRPSRIYNESLIAQCHRLKWEEARLEHENCRDWFNYIRGYGPAVWVRNGPELRWHPPSIPFAKRVYGTKVRPWEGVTDIPRQPDISPLRVNEIHDDGMPPIHKLH